MVVVQLVTGIHYTVFTLNNFYTWPHGHSVLSIIKKVSTYLSYLSLNYG